ncbi:RNA methyltransferase, TrmH family, group 3 [Hyphomicrobium denitrificans ATCC 51888]|uniref:RNA methyltransferase, TrmH family, group 3 n=1 Tax=Hyphomicrobium denitrificans (strain ATCC 51888 / DSM 1869 / NCIMB 11706 / TK 0415) TaxID=582899 RepID=D8JUD2_HYPDA|nr:RNA methyltransferase, TrmH family, group 3 [Hyphomicrobium denitrificans ATCC 51888]
MSKDHFKKPWRDKNRFSASGGQRYGRPLRAKTPHRGGPASSSGENAEGPLVLFGLHAVEAALKNPKRRVHRLMLTENAERRLIEAVGPITAKIDRVTPRDLDRLLGPDTVHQGVALETEPLPEPDWDELARAADGRPLIVLDQVTDPHNVGAILRSSAVFGASGLVMTHRHSPPLNGVLAKSASGALELIPVALVANLARAMEELREAGFALVGLDGEAETAIEDLDWSRPTALVMGSEGKGLRELTRKTCDTLARISTDGPVASLNVSNAAAIALYAAMRARRK